MVQNYDGHINISAADVAFAITAFLCESSKDLEDLKVSKDSFFEAYDAIQRTELLLRGVALAITFQKQLIDQGCSLLISRKVTCPGPFRYVILDSPTTNQITHPLSLTKLANFLMEAYVVCNFDTEN